MMTVFAGKTVWGAASAVSAANFAASLETAAGYARYDVSENPDVKHA